MWHEISSELQVPTSIIWVLILHQHSNNGKQLLRRLSILTLSAEILHRGTISIKIVQYRCQRPFLKVLQKSIIYHLPWDFKQFSESTICIILLLLFQEHTEIPAGVKAKQTHRERHSLLSTKKDAECMCPHSFLCLISQTHFWCFSRPCLIWTWIHSRTDLAVALQQLAPSHLSNKGSCC